MECPRVLAIQSHVVFGYCGNKSATFPLQILGFEVDAINSVQFSNHTGYKVFKGQVLGESELSDLMDGLSANGLDFKSHLLTGYVKSATFLTKISEVIKHLKTVNPKMVYVCDPVMGDNGAMYVPKELLPIYKKDIIPLCDILTPNQYEAELLTGISIRSIDDAIKAIDSFHALGVKTVVLSSTEFGKEGMLLSVASSMVDGKKTRVKIEFPKYAFQFIGTGDLFTALLLAWMHKTNDIKLTMENIIATMQEVLKTTIEYSEGKCGCKNLSTPADVELKLIQNKDVIENPKIIIKAEFIV